MTTLDVHPKLTKDEARALTEEIRSDFIRLPQKILLAYRGEIWTALGYESFREWGTQEYGIAKTQVYQLLNYARVEESLSAIAEKPLNEAQARELAPLVDQPEALREVFASATEAAKAEGKPLTARHIEVEVERIEPKTKRNGSAPPPHGPGTITDAELNEGDKGDPVWRCAFAFRECDDRQKFKALGQIIDDMDAETQVLAGALILSVYSPAQIVALCKQVDLGTLLETSKGAAK